MALATSRGLTFSRGAGDFYCPRCDGFRGYEHRSVVRFATVAGLPVWPLERVGEHVECRGCQATFEPAVLAGRGELAATFERVVLRVMVLMMLADDVVDDAEVVQIRVAWEQLTGRNLDREAVIEEIAQAELDGGTATEFVLAHLGALNAQGKDMVLRAAYAVAAADGEFQDEEIELLEELAQALEVPGEVFTALLGELDRQAK